jgi:hypothetical protein
MNRSKFLRIAALAGALAASTSLSAQMFLDEVMSREEQRSTGVYRLKPREKTYLECWLNENFVLKSACSVRKSEKKARPVFMSINIRNGEQIKLSDGSVWEIDPADYPVTTGWITSFPVNIIRSEDMDYPFELVNLNTGVSARARKVQPSEIEEG